ncbi:sigma-70 family RNA polymerase sigma factor [Ameyamaea chiangmaiensis]|nr:sigma-70 family RNA polymerase sigma factor [Ameyamaea chiangmaiensis]MBS4076544.1 sigma-70 family RNA polymerase sigma factor [Ameyamaea chiangmaiensis]
MFPRPSTRHRQSYLDAPDGDLLMWAAEGDTAAFEQVVRRHGRAMLRVARRLAPERAVAEDLVQETFMRAWKNARQFDGSRGAVVTWLYRIVTNLCIDARRRRTPDMVTEDPGIASPLPLSDEIIERTDEIVALSNALTTLPAHYAAVFTLVYDEGLTGVQAADILGLSVKAVERRLFRARALLRTSLLPERRSLT